MLRVQDLKGHCMYIMMLILLFCCLLLLSFRSQTIAAVAPLKLCDHSEIAAAYNISGKLLAHVYTDRGIDAFSANCHPLIWRLVLNITQQHSDRPVRVLEVGCGNGRALLDLQYLFRDQAVLTCVNKGGYRYPQANGDVDFVRLAVQSNMSLLCDSVSNKPLVPEVYLTNLGLGKEPFPGNMWSKFDFVYSQYALDTGKIDYNEIGPAIERVVDSLRVGGVAVILPCLSFKYFTNMLNILEMGPLFSIVRHANTAKFSVLMYIYRGHYIGIVIKRCGNDTSDRRSHGCFDQQIGSVFGGLNVSQMKSYVSTNASENFRRIYQSAVSPDTKFSRKVKQDGYAAEWEYRFNHFREAMKWFKGLNNSLLE